ncbi:MAG: DMT family transporter [Acidobacteriota bacterium]
MSDPMLGVIFALIASTSWAGGAVFARVGMKQVSSSIGTLISLMAGFLVISSIALIIDFEAVFKVPFSTLRWLALLGLIQFPVGRFLHYNGIRLAGVGPASTMGGAVPLFAVIMAIIFLGEPLTVSIAVGTVAVVLGLALVMNRAHAQRLPRDPAGSRPSANITESPPVKRLDRTLVLGILSSLAGATAYAAGHNIARHVVTSAASAPVTASYTLFFGMVILAVISLPRLGTLLAVPRTAFFTMATAGVLSSLAIFFMYTALSMAPVTLASPLVALYPLIAMTLTHFFLQRLERITIGMVIGAVIVAVGVTFVIVGGAV